MKKNFLDNKFELYLTFFQGLKIITLIIFYLLNIKIERSGVVEKKSKEKVT